MRRHKLTLIGLACVVSLFVTAQASGTVTVSPGGTVTATARTTPTYLTVTGGTMRVTLQCTSSSAVGVLSSNATVGSPTIAAPQFYAGVTRQSVPIDSTQGNVLLHFTTCRVAGVPFTVTCDGRSNIGATDRTVVGLTPNRLTGISCKITVTGCAAGGVVVTGAVSATYDNPFNRLTVLGGGQSLSVASSCSIVPSGTAKFSSSSTVIANVDYSMFPSTTVTVP